jgi:hypothetical protein
MPLDTPPAHIAPAPIPANATSLVADFDAAASPALKSWADTETAALLAAPLDLARLERDAAHRAVGASDPATAALILRYIVELRLNVALARPTSPPVRQAATVPSPSPAMDASQGAQETQMSFNPQYLQLQANMQNDSRQFTSVSNIMKTKHDTVKNTISNIH